jgi:hypothetical protein
VDGTPGARLLRARRRAPQPARWVHAALEPATGQAGLLITERRDSRDPIRLIEQVVQQSPSDRWLLTEDNLSIDNLSIHTSKQARRALTEGPEIQVQLLSKATPSKGNSFQRRLFLTYAPWLNLTQPWLKQL